LRPYAGSAPLKRVGVPAQPARPQLTPIAEILQINDRRLNTVIDWSVSNGRRQCTDLRPKAQSRLKKPFEEGN